MRDARGFWLVADDIFKLVATDVRGFLNYLDSRGPRRPLEVLDPYDFAAMYEDGIEHFYF